MVVCLDLRNGTGCNTQNSSNARFCVKCGRELRYALEVRDPGTVINDYKVIRLLGYGAFGSVYECAHVQQPLVSVAVKETIDPSSIHGFRDEFAVLRSLGHPNLPRYYDMFESGGHGYLVMEFVAGQNLDDIIRRERQPLYERQVLGYAGQICAGLSYLHTQRPSIVHRDVKPANIRLTPEGLIKLVDFGLLKQGDAATVTSRRAMTPAYAPLEQFNYQGMHTDVRSDIYSLGATLYLLLTKRDPASALERIAAPTDPLEPPLSVNPGLSRTVSDAIVRAMALRPQDRFAAITDFENALMGRAQSVRAVGSASAQAPPTIASSTRAAPPAPNLRTVALPSSAHDIRKLRKSAFITYDRRNPDDRRFALWLTQQFKENGVPVVVDEEDFVAGMPRDRAFQQLIGERTHLIVVLPSTATHAIQTVSELDAHIHYAKEIQRVVVPVVHKPRTQIPLSIVGDDYVDFTRENQNEALARVLRNFDVTRITSARRSTTQKVARPVCLILFGAGLMLLVLICLLVQLSA